MSKNEQKKSNNTYTCDMCNYNTSRLSNFKRHLMTKAHISNLDYTSEQSRVIKKVQKHACSCGKSYVHHTSLYKHKKICPIDLENNSNQIENIEKEPEADTIKNIGNLCNMVEQLIEENKVLRENLIDISKKPTKVVQNIQNNRFNVINYLNTSCKDAMNLSDYIANIEYSFADLQYLHDNGLVKSIERTFIKGLKDMDKTKRPIHCSDSKRRQFYVKDKDEWVKDTDHDVIISSLKDITDQQCNVLKQWKNINKDWLDNEKKQEFANVVTRKIVDMYAEKTQRRILKNLNDLHLKSEH